MGIHNNSVAAARDEEASSDFGTDRYVDVPDDVIRSLAIEAIMEMDIRDVSRYLSYIQDGTI